MATVGELVHEVLRRGDGAEVRFVRQRHLSDGVFVELTEATYRHVWENSELRDDDDPGWQTYPGGIGPWWVGQADLNEEEGYRLHQLRSDVVHQLEADGRAVREEDRGLLRVRRPS